MNTRVGAYAVIPSEVRYDKRLAPAEKLLYAEITAAANFNGIAPDDRSYYSQVLNCSVRSVFRYLERLELFGHIQREGRAIKIPVGFVKATLIASEADKPQIDQEYPEELVHWFEGLFDYYESGLSIKVERHDLFYSTLKDRLKTFSRNEMKAAITNRINFINNSEWHQLPENKPQVVDIMLVIRDDDAVRKSLNLKIEPKEKDVLKPLKFQ